MSGKITAPFTARQVEILNQYQQSGVFHPFTCGNREHKGDDVLVAKEDGWHCPTCDYTQNWAHEIMVDTRILQQIALLKDAERFHSANHVHHGKGVFPPIEEKTNSKKL